MLHEGCCIWPMHKRVFCYCINTQCSYAVSITIALSRPNLTRVPGKVAKDPVLEGDGHLSVKALDAGEWEFVIDETTNTSTFRPTTVCTHASLWHKNANASEAGSFRVATLVRMTHTHEERRIEQSQTQPIHPPKEPHMNTYIYIYTHTDTHPPRGSGKGREGN